MEVNFVSNTIDYSNEKYVSIPNIQGREEPEMFEHGLTYWDGKTNQPTDSSINVNIPKQKNSVHVNMDNLLLN